MYKTTQHLSHLLGKNQSPKSNINYKPLNSSIMIGLFEGLTKYNSWSESAKRNLTDAEKAQIASASVINSENGYGLSMCFFMKNGGKYYRKLSSLSTLQEKDEVNVDSIQMIELSAPGENPVYRVDGELA